MQSGLPGILSHSDNHPRVACDNQPHYNIARKLLFLDYAICVTDCGTESLW